MNIYQTNVWKLGSHTSILFTSNRCTLILLKELTAINMAYNRSMCPSDHICATWPMRKSWLDIQ